MTSKTTPPVLEEDDSQENFVESRDPTELVLCLVLASCYLGLAKYCWQPLLMAQNWKLLFNVEGFFATIALVAILVGLRPYLSPSSLQLSNRGIKYRGPYWPQRKTVNWSQVKSLYISPELIIILYHPKETSKRVWPLLIASIYLSNREKIGYAFQKFCPITPVIMSSPALVSRLAIALAFLVVIIWILEMMIPT